MKEQTHEEKFMLTQLKSILLQDDRSEVEALKETLNTPALLEEKMQPILNDKITYIKNNFPQEFGAIVDNAIEAKLEASKEQLLNVIYPVLGQMIKKYITHQFQIIKERIDAQLRQTFSSKGVFRLFKARVLGVKGSDLILQDVDKAMIQEVFLIQQLTGLLAGSYSRTGIIDRDMIVGMLTAIQSFAQDALNREQDKLDTINYDNYKIILYNFPQYYIAVVLSGSLSALEKGAIADRLLEFASKETDFDLTIISNDVTEKISQRLETYFKDFSLEHVH